MIAVKILADSINPTGVRLTSWLLTYPRFIHSEFMTHRCFSRNAASSRAIPFEKMLQSVKDHPALPEYWTHEGKGMTAENELFDRDLEECKGTWFTQLEEAQWAARHCHEYGLHKSLCNRLLEPWSHITVLATAADHGNFFQLRAHPAAEPTFQVLAYRMLEAYLASIPLLVDWGGWHIPEFANTYPVDELDRIKVATARCARLSYLTFDGTYDFKADVELHDKLAMAGHWSPFEHCARAHVNQHPPSNFDFNGEFSHWVQYRKGFKGECAKWLGAATLRNIMNTKPAWIQV